MSTKSDETRKKIISSTLSLLNSSQLNKINMEDIAFNTGISRQALYKYFPSRIDLLGYLLKSIDKDRTLLEKLMIDQSLSIKEKLKSFIDYWGYNNEATYKVSSEIKLLRGSDQKVALILEERNLFFRQQCEQIIQILNDSGSLKSNFTYREARDIFCNLLSEDTWAYFNEQCLWSLPKYLEKIYVIIENLLIGASTKSTWSIRGY